MEYKNLFRDELDNIETNYFILDTKGARSSHIDLDFIKYSWRTNKYNKVREGDLFIYRRPSKVSETKEFYFFGAGKIKNIIPFGPTEEKRVEGVIEKPYPFRTNLFASDLEKYQWAEKERKEGSWANFFHQYGMNKITKDDFLYLLENSEGVSDFEYDSRAATGALKDIQNQNYYVDDEIGEIKRRSKQSVFANQVKTNYRNRCAICNISTKAFLIGSHIIPWSKNKNIRLDPSNGISLCVLHDKLFDKGYITLDEDLRVLVSSEVYKDEALTEYVEKIENKKIKKPVKQEPKAEYISYHREVIFQR